MVLLAIAALTACESDARQLRLVTPTEPIDKSIIEDVADLLDDSAAVSVHFTGEPLSEEAALAAIVSGEADLALVSNDLPFHSDIATVMPLYPTVLHIGRGDGMSSIFDFHTGGNTTVFAGPEGSASRRVFERVTARLNLGDDAYHYVDHIEDVPDVVIVFAPIDPDRIVDIRHLKVLYEDFRFSSMGAPDDIGKGTIIDAAILFNPHFRPFVIPVGTYDDLTDQPILTVAVDKILVTRQDIDSAIIYDLVNEVLRLRPAMAARRRGVFQQLEDDFDVSRSTYIVHAGTQAYLQREAPSVYERYSGIAEVVVTVIVALGSAIFAFIRIFRMRRKNRIDKFYTKTIALRRSVNETTSPEEVQRTITEIRELQATAFDLLVDEKLAADESFRIFITLSNDVLRQLGDPSELSQLSAR